MQTAYGISGNAGSSSGVRQAEAARSYRKYGFAALAPFAGVEIPFGGKVNVVVKLDYLLNLSNPQDDFVTGPRLYLGFMFGHSD